MLTPLLRRHRFVQLRSTARFAKKGRSEILLNASASPRVAEYESVITMKTFLFALLAFITLSIAAPVAQAGQFARVYTKHGPVYLHKSQLYGGNYNNGYHHRYNHRRHHHRSYRYAPSYYSRPVYSNYGYYRPSYYRPHCGYRSSPRVAISFGF
jgi:hypothetical protein